MFGDAARGLTFSMGEDFKGALLAILPPGAFIGLGLMLALKNNVDHSAEKRAKAKMQNEQPETAPQAS
jgi:electron transport complex protein RnfE